ncbi:MAG: flagellin hook IN motif-containing protein [Woeseiaceae bacterium]|nr:flagellin hook IN motif-containing protein [Woeseiaceae bacterium]
MSVILGLNSLANAARIGQTGSTPQGLKPFLPVDDGSGVDFRRARTRLIGLFQRLEELAELADVSTRFKLDLPDARSTQGLGLDLTETAAALNSTEEINASPMSFSPFGPGWDGSSTALITIGGEYDGSHGSGPITFEVRRAGVRGQDDLRIRVEDSQGNRIRNINIRDHHALDRQYDLQNGLYLTLGNGSLTNRDTASITVSDSVGAVVDPTRPLGGIRNSNPNLQFGTTPIVDGSFLVNGESISVSTADSINDVITRINQSAAGVTATFNAGTERIDFVQDTAGSVPTIDLQNDTSNLLDALKLSGAVVVPGTDREDEQALADVSQFASVQSGDLLINGRSISIDTASDSLADVLDRINASPANVVASFDDATQRVVIEARDAASVLEIDSNGTGFFGALNIVEGRVDPEAVSRGVSRARSYDIADAAAAAFAELNYLFRDASFVGRDANAARFRAPLESALRTTFGDDLTANLLGLNLDGSANARLRGDFATVDRQTLTRNLQLRGDTVKSLLTNAAGDAGLIVDLMRATRQALTGVNQALGISGTFVDTFA